MIISRTSFRLGIAGGSSDYPAWYKRNGGEVISAGIDKFCYLAVRFLPPFFPYKYRVIWSQIENCQEKEEIRHPAVRAIIEKMEMEKGIEVHHFSDLPARSGIGSSSAFTVGLLNALHALKGDIPTHHELALEAIEIEQNVLKEAVGSQDQVMAAYGGLNHISFREDGEIICDPICLPEERITILSNHLLLFYTGIERTASEVAKTYDLSANEISEIQGITKEVLETLRGGEIADLGLLLHRSWQLKRRLSGKISNPEIDFLYGKALNHGALGGKITGAGGGGFLLLFVPPERQDEIKQAFSNLLYVPFKFDHSGSRIVYFDREE